MEKLRSSKLICVFKVIYNKEYLIPLLQLYHGCLSESSSFSLWWPAGKLAVLMSQMLSCRLSLRNWSGFTYLMDSGQLAQQRPAFIWYVPNMESVRLLNFGMNICWRCYSSSDWNSASLTNACFIRQTCWLHCMLMIPVLQLLWQSISMNSSLPWKPKDSPWWKKAPSESSLASSSLKTRKSGPLHWLKRDLKENYHRNQLGGLQPQLDSSSHLPTWYGS